MKVVSKLDTNFDFCLKFFHCYHNSLCEKLSQFSHITLEIIHGFPELCSPWTKNNSNGKSH